MKTTRHKYNLLKTGNSPLILSSLEDYGYAAKRFLADYETNEILGVITYDLAWFYDTDMGCFVRHDYYDSFSPHKVTNSYLQKTEAWEHKCKAIINEGKTPAFYTVINLEDIVDTKNTTISDN